MERKRFNQSYPIVFQFYISILVEPISDFLKIRYLDELDHETACTQVKQSTYCLNLSHF